MPKEAKFIKLIDITMGNAIKLFFVRSHEPNDPAVKGKTR